MKGENGKAKKKEASTTVQSNKQANKTWQITVSSE